MNTLRVDSILFENNQKVLLNDVYLTLKTGDIIEIIGRNGAGKSTLLEIMFSSRKAKQLYFNMNGKVVINTNSFQKYCALKSQFSIFPKQLKFKHILASCYFEWDEFKGYENKVVQEFSTGIQQLIQCLFILELPQPFYLLDEPFNEISPLLQQKLLLLIKEKSNTKGIIITNHIQHLLSDYRTQHLELKNGGLKPY